MPASLNERNAHGYGVYSDDLNVLINGEPQHVTIYHRVLDSIWSEYTALLDDGTVVSQNRSLRHLLLDEDHLDESVPRI